MYRVHQGNIPPHHMGPNQRHSACDWQADEKPEYYCPYEDVLTRLGSEWILFCNSFLPPLVLRLTDTPLRWFPSQELLSLLPVWPCTQVLTMWRVESVYSPSTEQALTQHTSWQRLPNNLEYTLMFTHGFADCRGKDFLFIFLSVPALTKWNKGH